MIEMKPVKSSAVSHIGYDPETRELRVRFRSGGKDYSYPDISPELNTAILKSDSIGRAVAKLPKTVKDNA